MVNSNDVYAYQWINSSLYHRMKNWMHPVSVRPSVCRQGFLELFKTIMAQFIWYLEFNPIHFHVPSINFCPLVAKYLAENGISWIFVEIYSLNSFASWHLSVWGQFLTPINFFVFSPSIFSPWWIPGIRPFRVCLLTLIYFCVCTIKINSMVRNICLKWSFRVFFYSMTLQWTKQCRNYSDNKAF